MEQEHDFREQERMERSEDAVPLSDDTWKYGDMLIKTQRTHLERVKINEDSPLFTFIEERSCAAVIISCLFFHYYSNKDKST